MSSKMTAKITATFDRDNATSKPVYYAQKNHSKHERPSCANPLLVIGEQIMCARIYAPQQCGDACYWERSPTTRGVVACSHTNIVLSSALLSVLHYPLPDRADCSRLSCPLAPLPSTVESEGIGWTPHSSIFPFLPHSPIQSAPPPRVVPDARRG